MCHFPVRRWVSVHMIKGMPQILSAGVHIQPIYLCILKSFNTSAIEVSTFQGSPKSLISGPSRHIQQHPTSKMQNRLGILYNFLLLHCASICVSLTRDFKDVSGNMTSSSSVYTSSGYFLVLLSLLLA